MVGKERGLGKASSLTGESKSDAPYSPQNAETPKFDKAFFLREMSSANSPYQSWKVRYAIIQRGLKDNILELSGGFMWEVPLVQASEFIGKREVLSGQEVFKLEEFNTWWLDGDVVDGYRMSITLAKQSKQTINSVMVSIHETCEGVVQSYAMLDLSETLIKGDVVVHDFALPSVIGSSFSCVKIIAAKWIVVGCKNSLLHVKPWRRFVLVMRKCALLEQTSNTYKHMESLLSKWGYPGGWGNCVRI